MTWTYTNAPDETTPAGRRDAVRFNIGDTDSTVPFPLTLSDEEIAYCLSRAGNAVLAASIDALRSLKAQYDKLPDTTVVGEGSVQASEIRKAMQETMNNMTADAGKNANPRFGGQSIAANRRLDALRDVPQPTFKRDQDLPPGVSSSP